MRIDAINKMNQLYQATRPKKVNGTGSADVREKYEGYSVIETIQG